MQQFYLVVGQCTLNFTVERVGGNVNLQLMVIHELLDIVYLCAKLAIAESCNNEPI